jgi:hypothetical protein
VSIAATARHGRGLEGKLGQTGSDLCAVAWIEAQMKPRNVQPSELIGIRLGSCEEVFNPGSVHLVVEFCDVPRCGVDLCCSGGPEGDGHPGTDLHLDQRIDPCRACCGGRRVHFTWEEQLLAPDRPGGPVTRIASQRVTHPARGRDCLWHTDRLAAAEERLIVGHEDRARPEECQQGRFFLAPLGPVSKPERAG